MNDILLFVARFLAIWYIGGPVVTTLHEFGHAAAALMLTKGDVRVWIGSGQKGPRWRLGRLYLSLTYQPGFTGFYRCAHAPSRAARATIQGAGPLTSFIIAAAVLGAGELTGATGHWLGESVVIVFAYAAIGQFLATATPWRYPRGWGEYAGQASDGLRFLHTLRSHDTPRSRLTRSRSRRPRVVNDRTVPRSA